MQFTNIKKYITSKPLLSLIFIGIATSCVTIDESPQQDTASAKQYDLVDAALRATKMPYGNTFTFKNRQFNNDCSGLIYGIFWSAGIDMVSLIANESGNGVTRIYKVMDSKNLLHNDKLPNPGDLIFWSNTYGTWGKNPLSHIGIVISVNRTTGQVDYVHNNTYLGAVRRETMNLYKPHETRPVNNYMRYDRRYKKTAAELFEAFGMAWKL